MACSDVCITMLSRERSKRAFTGVEAVQWVGVDCFGTNQEA